MTMTEIILDFFKSFPPELATVLIAMIPITELRVSIPVALEVFKLPVLSAIWWSVVGAMIPTTVILVFIGDIANWFCQHSPFLKRLYNHTVLRTEKKFKDSAAKYGIGLGWVIFVAIPLPFTGAWSGALATFLLGMPKRFAWIMIFIGIVISAIIVALASLGIFKIF